MIMNAPYKVYLDPSSNIIYSSYYIKGLHEVFGKKSVRFSSEYFEGLDKRDEDYSYDSYMAFVILNETNIHKVIIDFGDDSPIRKNAFQWCDVYAKINIDPSKLSDYYQAKILSIPPGFGIKIWNVSEALYHSFSNLIKLKFSPQISLKDYFRSYVSQLKQLKIETFFENKAKNKAAENKVFFISSLWPHPNCLTGTNIYRKMFMDSCVNNKVNFEGGFWVPDVNHPQFNEFKHLIFTQRYPLSQYVEKTKESLFVFNTPAVHNCHGWKLGQFLAMNKAIISTPFQNVLPEDLAHGENIHFVSNKTQLDTAICKLLSDIEYRRKLESGAKAYFEKYASPDAVIQHIFQKLEVKII